MLPIMKKIALVALLTGFATVTSSQVLASALLRATGTAVKVLAGGRARLQSATRSPAATKTTVPLQISR